MIRRTTISIFIVLIVAGCSPSPEVQDLTSKCFNEWKARGWTIDGEAAYKDTNVRVMIQRICSARAELHAEGYRIAPYVRKEDIRVYTLSDGINDFKRVLRKSIR